MKQVDFYILSRKDETSRKLFACKISEKAYKMKKTIHISSPDKDYSENLSELLWNYKEESFLPNEIQTKETKENAKCILISHNQETSNKSDVLINLSEIEVDKCNRFERVIEIVLNQENSKKKARKRFVEFRDLGYKVKSHQM